MTQHCTITGTMLVPVHYIICTLKIVFFPEITVFVVVKINSFQCQCQCQYNECSIRLGSFSESGLRLCIKSGNEFASLIFLLHKNSLSIIKIGLS